MDRIFRGIMKYRRTNRAKMVEQFIQVKNHPEVRLTRTTSGPRKKLIFGEGALLGCWTLIFNKILLVKYVLPN